MDTQKLSNQPMKNGLENQKVMLMLLPFWTPLIPPLGISCLKSHLNKHGYEVVLDDINTDLEISEVYYNYNDVLNGFIPKEKQGNFYNTAHKVLRNHAMAAINYQEKKKYYNFVKLLISKHYFTDINDQQVEQLDTILKSFYSKLEKNILQALEEHKPGIVGISVYTGTLPASLFAFKLIKEKCPEIKTVMGGGIFADQLSINSPNFKHFTERYAKYIDKIIVGEGEDLLLKYLQGKLPKDQKVFTLKDNCNETIDISNVEVPDFTGLDVLSYPQLAVYVSRSCPFQCSFCSETVQWGKYRKKGSTQIADEMVKLYDKYRLQLFLFGDSLVNPVIDDISAELINRELSLYWDGYLRADRQACDVEKVRQWRRGGFYRARLGVESGSPKILELMSKKITPDLIRDSVKTLAEAGIKTTTYWVVGHPEETEQDFMQTLDLIEEIKDYIYEAECNPFQYFPSSQIDSDFWANKYGAALLFPEDVTDMIVTQTWTLNVEPSWEEIYRRVIRFVEHCKKLGIPNPYTLREVYLADTRWQKLHKNAVPLITEFKNRKVFINENKKYL